MMSSAEGVYLQEVNWVLSLVLLVGCWSDEPGLHLEVRAEGTGATRIELYLATRPCMNCAGFLKPKDVRTKLPGPVWLLDGDMMARTPNTVYDVKAGKVVFDLLPPGAEDVDIEYVVAVGYDANGKVVGVAKLTGVTVPHAHAKFWKIALDGAADQASSMALKPEGNRVWVWRRSDPMTSALAACVGIEHSDGKTVERTWLVPADDTDCDEVPPNAECDRFNYQAMGTSDLDKANCVTALFKPPGITTTTCLLGGPACNDGHADMTCGPVDPYYCVPDALCSNPSCIGTNMLPQCVAANIASHLKVTFASETNLDWCSNAGTVAPRVQVDLTPLLRDTGLPAVTSCTSIEFVQLGIQNIDPKPDYQSGSAKFHTEALTAPCTFDMVWEKGPLPVTDLFAGLDITLKNGLHLALPLHITVALTACIGGAPEPIVKVLPGDSILNCVRVPDL
jgi:hypothetical protein